MKIAVCIKSVPDPECYDQITIHSETKRLVREGIPSVINSSDKHALELALQLKECHGGEVTVLTMAPPSAKQQLLEALAMGADRAYLLSDKKLGGADTLATSYTLSMLIKKTGNYDLILAGNESADGATSHVPSQTAEWLKIGHSMNVISMEMKDISHALVTKQFENGRGVYLLKLPCVIAVNQRINEVRYTNAMDILKAKRKPLEIWSSEDLPDLNEDYIGLNGSPSKAGELKTMEFSKSGVILKGSDEEIADVIFEKIGHLLSR